MRGSRNKACKTCVVVTQVRQIRDEARAALRLAGLVHAVAEADALLAALLGRSRGDLELDVLVGRSIGDDDAARVEDAVARRVRREPLQHIVGSAPFAGIDLEVGPGAFVPRPETELLVEVGLRGILERGNDEPRVADLGSGTGAIAIAVARRLVDAGTSPHVWAIEGSPHAWPWLTRNVTNLAPAHVHPVFDRIGPRAIAAEARPLDALLSNPPYIPAANEPPDLEVRRFDPSVALYGGDDGLDVIRDIAALGTTCLADGGQLVLEHDDHHGESVRALLEAAGYHDVATHLDLAGRDRVTSGRV